MKYPCVPKSRLIARNAGQVIRAGMLLMIEDKDSEMYVYQCKEILNEGTDSEEVLLTDDGSNLYFIWSMCLNEESWAKNVWTLGEGKIYEPNDQTIIDNKELNGE